MFENIVSLAAIKVQISFAGGYYTFDTTLPVLSYCSSSSSPYYWREAAILTLLALALAKSLLIPLEDEEDVDSSCIEVVVGIVCGGTACPTLSKSHQLPSQHQLNAYMLGVMMNTRDWTLGEERS